jgi:hypothetical protein
VDTTQPASKLALRDQLTTARNRLGLAEVGVAARALAEVLLAAPEVRRAASVAAYVSIGNEPGTGPLLDGLVAAGKRVILPVLLPGGDLDWGVYTGEAGLARAREKLERKALDAVVLNDISRADIGFDAAENEVTILTREGERSVARALKDVVAGAILDEVEALRGGRLELRP